MDRLSCREFLIPPTVYAAVFIALLTYAGCSKNTENSVAPGNPAPVDSAISATAPWTQVNAGLNGAEVFALAVNNGRVFAGTFDSGIFISTNDGSNWSSISKGLPMTSVSCFTFIGSNVYAGSDSGVFLSTNTGASWKGINSGLPSDVKILCLVASGADLIAGSWGQGLFRSTNNGVSWNDAAPDLPFDAQVFSLLADGSNVFAGTAGGVFRSTNGGTNWSPMINGFAGTTVSVHALASNGANIFAGLYGGGMYRSTNNGTSWKLADSGLTNPNVVCLICIGPNLLAGIDDGLFLSTNNAASWTYIGFYQPGVYDLAWNNDYIFQADYLGRVLRRAL